MAQEEIAHQLKLLGIHRRNIRVYQNQLRILGAHAPPGVFHGIQEERAAIKRIKGITGANDDAIDAADDWEKAFGVEDV